MRKLDQKDIEILQLLQEDARRPYSEIANKVDLSPPTVSDRVERLKEHGVIDQMTIEVNRDGIDDWESLLLEVTPNSRRAEQLEEELLQIKYTQEIFRTVEGHLTVKMRGPIETVRKELQKDLNLSPEEISKISMVSSVERSMSVPMETLEGEQSAPATR